MEECIASIQNQNINHEIIVIDDISTDSTVKIAQKMGCHVSVNQTHMGQVAEKNIGIRISKGNYMLTIDQDDKLPPRCFKDTL